LVQVSLSPTGALVQPAASAPGAPGAHCARKHSPVSQRPSSGVPAFAGDAAVVGTRNAIVTRARDARARAAEASIADGAAVAVVAGGPVLPGGIATGPRRGIARSGGVALIECRADHGLGAHADRTLTGVGLRAAVAVVAARAVGPGGIAAGSRRGIAGAGGVALIGGRAHDGVHAHADAGLTGVGARAGVALVAAGAVGLGGIT